MNFTQADKIIICLGGNSYEAKEKTPNQTPRLTQKDLSNLLDIHQGSISRNLQKLKAKGLIEAKNVNIEGRSKKVHVYYLSDQGVTSSDRLRSQLFTQTIMISNGWETKLLRGFEIMDLFCIKPVDLIAQLDHENVFHFTQDLVLRHEIRMSLQFSDSMITGILETYSEEMVTILEYSELPSQTYMNWFHELIALLQQGKYQEYHISIQYHLINEETKENPKLAYLLSILDLIFNFLQGNFSQCIIQLEKRQKYEQNIQVAQLQLLDKFLSQINRGLGSIQDYRAYLIHIVDISEQCIIPLQKGILNTAKYHIGRLRDQLVNILSLNIIPLLEGKILKLQGKYEQATRTLNNHLEKHRGKLDKTTELWYYLDFLRLKIRIRDEKNNPVSMETAETLLLQSGFHLFASRIKWKIKYELIAANLHLTKENYQQVSFILDWVESTAQRLDYPLYQILSLYSQGIMHIKQSNIKKAVEKFNASYKLSDENEYILHSINSKIRHTILISYFNPRKQFPQSNQLVTQIEMSKTPILLSKTYLIKALIVDPHTNCWSRINYLIKFLTSDTFSEDEIMLRIYALMTIGDFLVQIGKFNQSLKYLNKALYYSIKYNIRFFRPCILISTCIIHLFFENWLGVEESISKIILSISSQQSTNDNYMNMQSYVLEGHKSFFKGQLEMSCANYQKAFQILKDKTTGFHLKWVLSYIASLNLYVDPGQISEVYKEVEEISFLTVDGDNTYNQYLQAIISANSNRILDLSKSITLSSELRNNSDLSLLHWFHISINLCKVYLKEFEMTKNSKSLEKIIKIVDQIKYRSRDYGIDVILIFAFLFQTIGFIFQSNTVKARSLFTKVLELCAENNLNHLIMNFEDIYGDIVIKLLEIGDTLQFASAVDDIKHMDQINKTYNQDIAKKIVLDTQEGLNHVQLMIIKDNGQVVYSMGSNTSYPPKYNHLIANMISAISIVGDSLSSVTRNLRMIKSENNMLVINKMKNLFICSLFQGSFLHGIIKLNQFTKKVRSHSQILSELTANRGFLSPETSTFLNKVAHDVYKL